MTIAAGANIEADDLAPAAAKGYVTHNTRTTASSNFTGTEVIVQSVTFTATAGQRIKVTAVQSYESTEAGNLLEIRLRYATGGSVDASGTEFASVFPNADVASRGQPVCIVGHWLASSSGQYTVGVGMKRSSGAGTCKSFGSTVMQNQLLVEVI